MESKYIDTKNTKTYSLYKILDLYGYTQDSQKSALTYLMQQAEIIPTNQTFQEFFPTREKFEDLAKDIVSFVRLTQKHFTIRSGTQERWEIEAPSWLKQNQTAIINNLEILGFVKEIRPNFHNPDAICILGALKHSMKYRIDYANKLIDSNDIKTNNIILLAGERKITLGKDGNAEEMESIAKKYNLANLNDVTETQLIQEAYQVFKNIL